MERRQHKSLDSLKLFFEAKQITLEKVLFSVLDGTSAIGGKERGLQRRMQHSPFSIYVNCCNQKQKVPRYAG